MERQHSHLLLPATPKLRYWHSGPDVLGKANDSAYFASQEDVNARALLAIRADNPIQVQPLTTLTTIQR